MTSRRKRPTTAGIAPPLRTIHQVLIRNRRRDDPSFFTLVLQVGVVVAVLLCIVYTCCMSSSNVLLFWAGQPAQVRRRHVKNPNQKRYRVHYRPATADPPEMSLSSLSSLSKHLIVSPVETEDVSSNNNHNNHNNNDTASLTAKAATQLRNGFSDMYGGFEIGKNILQRGVWSPDLDAGTDKLTQYIRDKKKMTPRQDKLEEQEDIAFHIVVAGNSAPAGYGNHRHESYASRLEELLYPIFHSVGVRLVVSNFAMNDLTEFPFTWCLHSHYIQDSDLPTMDMIVWDFNGPDYPVARFEAFLRYIANAQVPFLVVRNGFRNDLYFDLIQYYYAKHNVGQDITVLSDGHAVEEFWENDNQLPYGLSNWDHFGAPGGTPDKLHPHLSVQEHWLIAWLLSMRLLPALEQLASNTSITQGLKVNEPPAPSLPPPLLLTTGDTWLLGERQPAANLITCFTGFEHVLRKADMSEVTGHLPVGTSAARTNLPLLLAPPDNGNLAETFKSLDPDLWLKPKSVQFFHQGWVYDLEAAAKRSKQRTQQSGFLGFTDWKTAFYGEYQSGILALRIPVPTHSVTTTAATPVDQILKRLVLCQSDEPLQVGSCSISKDLKVTIGGEKSKTSMVDSRVVKTINSKPLCLSVEVPSDGALYADETATDQAHQFLVPVDIEVSNDRVRWNQGPCSIAHVLAEWNDSQ